METGLGWDRLHPRALDRISQGTLLWLCAALHNAERTGEWPAAAELILIALLPKAEGGVQSYWAAAPPPTSLDEDEEEHRSRMGSVCAHTVPLRW